MEPDSVSGLERKWAAFKLYLLRKVCLIDYCIDHFYDIEIKVLRCSRKMTAKTEICEIRQNFK